MPKPNRIRGDWLLETDESSVMQVSIPGYYKFVYLKCDSLSRNSRNDLV